MAEEGAAPASQPAAPATPATPAAPATPTSPGNPPESAGEQGGGAANGPEEHPVVEGGHNYKYRKLLYLFKFSKHGKKGKKSASKHSTLPAAGTPEERRSQLDQDMKNSWDTLPETLRKRKQRVSRALLSEFIDADNTNAAGQPADQGEGQSATPGKDDEEATSKSSSPDLDKDGAEASKVLDALHRSGVYYDDEDVEDDEEDTKSSTSSSSSEKSEVCVYQVQPSKGSSPRNSVEIVTRAMFHQQDDEDEVDAPTPPPAPPAPPPVPGPGPPPAPHPQPAPAAGTETQIGEEEIYQKIHFEEVKCDPLERLKPVIPSEETMEEIPLSKTEDGSGAVAPVAPSTPVVPAAPPVPFLAPPQPPAFPKTLDAGHSDADSGVEAKGGSCHSSLGDEYATVGRSCEESDATVAADDNLYSRLQPKSGKQAEQDVKQEDKQVPQPPLGLDSDALAAVEMLARAVSSDSLLAGSSHCSPANSHSSLDNMKLHEDDSGTDVNNPSSSSSAASSCAGDAVPAAECGEYEDVSPPPPPPGPPTPPCPPPGPPLGLAPGPHPVLPPGPPSGPPAVTHPAEHHEYESMLIRKTPTMYSAVGKAASTKPAGKPAAAVTPLPPVAKLSAKPPAPGAQPLPGMYGDDKGVSTVKPGASPQFLIEALSKRAAAVARQDDEHYALMDKTPTIPTQHYVKKGAGSSGLAGRSSATGSALLSKSASGCVAALSHLSAQKFPPHLTAPIFYNPLVQCPLEDSALRPGNKKPCPVFKPHGFEPLAGDSPGGGSGGGASSDSEHLTDSFDEDEAAVASSKPGLVEEPLWRRPAEPSLCSWRTPLDPLACRRSVTMETIVEEPHAAAAGGHGGHGAQDGPDDSRLTVREILRRFEELGGKVPSLCEDEHGARGLAGEDEEKTASLREIQETLMNLEEKVRNYQCKMASSTDKAVLPAVQQPAHTKHHHHHHHHSSQQRGGGRLDSFQPDPRKSIDGWTGRVQSAPHQQQAQPQQPAQQGPGHGPGPGLGHGPGHGHGPASMPPPLTNGHHSNGPSSLPIPLSEHGSGLGHGQVHDGKHSLLQFAIHHFRQSPEKFEMLKTADGSISGSLDVIESLKTKKNKGKSKGNKENEWTWKEQVDLVKFAPRPIEQSLLRLETEEMSELAVECFVCVMRYMGDLPMTTDVTEVKCVYTVLMHCHKYEALRDEVYCQLMKQTTNNKSQQPESCQRGWRLFSIVAAYFACSDTLKPYLFKYLETAAYDKRRAYHGTATVCLQNLRKTFKYGGRKNVPSVEEITAISAGRNSKRQMYRLPGGTERVVNTRSTTVVQDVIEEICGVINVTGAQEMEEFSLYCIVEGDTFTMPLAREEYILDVTTELHKNQQVFYLIFCRSVWHFPLRLDSHLYIEVVFNQIAPDYLEGLLLVMPGETLQQDTIYEIAKMAALLHRAADMSHVPAMKETKFLLPKPALTVRDIKPAQWVNMVQGSWVDVQGLETIQAKAQVLEMLSRWPLFGSSFFAVKRVSDPKERADHILALNRHGVHFVDIVTHETLLHHPFSEVISTRKVKSEDGTLFLDMKCGNLMQQRITRLQTDQAHEISRLIRQYITLQQRVRT